MRISDWSSDVCSSDLRVGVAHRPRDRADVALIGDGLDVRGDLGVGGGDDLRAVVLAAQVDLVAVVIRRVVAGGEIGRESWRERGCQYVLISVVAVVLNKQRIFNETYMFIKSVD